MVKTMPTEWEKAFDSCSSDKELISRLHAELKQLNTRKIQPINVKIN